MRLQKVFKKTASFLKSTHALARFNWQGFPLIPKNWSRKIPYNRENYNNFISWIGLLGFKTLNRVVDVGANHGDFSLAVSAFNPTAYVLMFEPLPNLHEELEARAHHFSGWQLDRRALGNSSSTMNLQIVEGRDDIGTLAEFSEGYVNATAIERKKIETIPCNVTTLDNALCQYGIRQVDLIKIDVEGYEFEVLQGAVNSLEFIDSIIIEISFLRKENAARDPLANLLEFLSQYEFRIIQIFPSIFCPTEPWLPLEYNLLLRKAPKNS